MFDVKNVTLTFNGALTPEQFNQQSLNEKASYLSKSLFNDAKDACIDRYESYKKNQFRLVLVSSSQDEGREVENRIPLGTATNAKSKKEKFQSDLLSDLYFNLYTGAVKTLSYESNFVTRHEYGQMNEIREMSATIEKAPEQKQEPVSDVNSYITGILDNQASEKAPRPEKVTNKAAAKTKTAKTKTAKAKKAAPKKSKATPKAKKESETVLKTSEPLKASSPSKEEAQAVNLAQLLTNKDLKQSDKIKAINEQLMEGLNQLANSQQLEDYIKFCSKFHNYSFRNRLLLYLQAQERGMKLTHVAGTSTWNAMGQTIKKGEKALYVWAPIVIKPKKDEQEEETEEEEESKVLFTLKAVFDASQLKDPESLPESICKELKGEMDNFNDIKAALVKYVESTGVSVSFEDTGSSAYGFYSPDRNAIVVKDGLSDEQTIKTLSHEIAHSINDRNPLDGKTREEREVIAETVSYYLMLLLGVDSSQYSLGYILSWSNGMDGKEVKEHLETIEKTALDVYQYIEKELGTDKKRTKAKENLNAQRETQQKAKKQAQQEKKAALMEELKDFEQWPFEGGKVIINTAADRVQIYFDEKPSEKIRTSLKKHAWRYSPKNAGAWQRKITDNAKACCKEILGLA